MSLAERQAKMRVRNTGEDYLTERQAAKRYWEKRKQEQKPKKPIDVLIYLNTLHQKAVHRNRRLELLREAAQIVLSNVSVAELTLKRLDFDQYKYTIFPVTGMCWLCDKNPATARHHLISLQHGGPQLLRANLVMLCDDCFSIVHPWSLSSLPANEVTRIIQLLEGAKNGKYSRTQVNLEVESILDSIFAP